MGELGHHFPHRAQASHVGQFGLMTLQLLLGPAPLIDLDPQSLIGVGQLGSALPHALFQLGVRFTQFLLRVRQSFGLAKPGENLRQYGRQELDERGAFREVVLGAAFHHLHRHGLAAMPGDHDKRNATSAEFQVRQELLAPHVGQAVIQEHQLRGVRVEPSKGRGAVGGAHGAEALPVQARFNESQEATSSSTTRIAFVQSSGGGAVRLRLASSMEADISPMPLRRPRSALLPKRHLAADDRSSTESAHCDLQDTQNDGFLLVEIRFSNV